MSGTAWRKSSHSDNFGKAMGVRDSKDPAAGRLCVDRCSCAFWWRL
ncbi:DUF397 domain-containing protein [Actinomadura kijaniata]